MPSFLRWQIPIGLDWLPIGSRLDPDETSFSMMVMTVAAESADTAASIDRRMILTKIKTDFLRWNMFLTTIFAKGNAAVALINWAPLQSQIQLKFMTKKN